MLRKARLSDAQDIADLVNLAYRGTKGWTTEHDLVSGDRITRSQVTDMLQQPGSHVLVWHEGSCLKGCICVELKPQKEAYIGLFAVHPDAQGAGLGHQILTDAERYAVEDLGARVLMMLVVTERPALLAFYERRGYRRTGQRTAFPVHLNVGTPVSGQLAVEQLAKPVMCIDTA